MTAAAMARPRTHRAQVALLVEVGLLVLVVALFPHRATMDAAEGTFLTVTVLAPCLIALAAWVSPKHLWSFPAAYMVTFTLFHFGAVATYAVSGMSEYGFRPWLLDPTGVKATWAALAGGVTLLIGVHLTALRDTRRAVTMRRFVVVEGTRTLATLSTLVLAGAVALWLTSMVRAGGVGVLFGAYSEYNAIRAGLSPWPYLGIGIGAILTACSPPGGWRTAGFAVFGLYAVLALPLGLRGEVLFPALAGAATWAQHNKVPSVRRTLALIAVLLLLISAIGAVRQVGWGAASGQLGALNITNPVAEMGTSLRPTVEVMRLQSNGALSLHHGATYWAPFDRLIGHILPFVGQRDAALDRRIVHREVDRMKAGDSGMGFSPIAEGWSNWGLWGVVVHMLAMGLVLGALNRGPYGPVRAAVAGVVFYALLAQVRGAFIVVPAQILVGLVVCFGVFHAAKVLTSR